MWRQLVEQYLAPFAVEGGITINDVERAEQWAANATAFSATGSWRARIVGGVVYVKLIRAHKHWAERASVLRMLLLAANDGAASLPDDVDFVYAHADNDPTPAPRKCKLARQRGRPCVPTRPLPLFTNSHDAHAGGLPVPEFTWTGWGDAEPWCRQEVQFDAAASAAPWTTRDRRLYFSGGLDNGHHRKALRALALVERQAGRFDELHIRDVSSKFHRWGQYDRDQPKETLQTLLGNASADALTRPGGGRRRERMLDHMQAQISRQSLVGPVAATAACGYQYAINVPGFGYSSRLRGLLRCGNAVVQVRHPSAEFFMPLLREGWHLFYISGREPVRDSLLPLLRELRKDSKRAAMVAANGRRFAQKYLSFGAVVGYFRELLRGYAALRRRSDATSGAARPPPSAAELRAQGYVRVSSEADLHELSGMCVGCRKAVGACVPHRPLPSCSLWAPKGGGRCFERRCCKGYDCASQPLGCPTQTGTAARGDAPKS